MVFNYNSFTLTIAMSLIDVIMMSLTKKYYLNDSKIKLILGGCMLVYMLQPLLFYKALFHEGIGYI